MFGNFNEEARCLLIKAKEEMYNLKHTYVGTEHVILAILKTKNEISEKLIKQKITYNLMLEKIKDIVGVGDKQTNLFLYSPMLKRIIENSILDSKDDKEDVTPLHIFINILEEGEGVGIRILMMLGANIDELYKDIVRKKEKKQKELLKLNEIGVLLNEKILDPVIGREKEIKRITEILLRRTKNNPILIGEAGVGKTAIVEELSKRIKEEKVPNKLLDKKIIQIDMAELVAGTKYRGEFEDKIKKILKEVEENENIILFIDEIHTIMGAGGAEGAIDASNILKPALARGKVSIIGATTTEEYKKFITEDKALDRRFQKVLVEEPTVDETKKILKKLRPIYENYHNALIKDNELEAIVDLSKKYIKDRNQPDASIDILDEALARVSLKVSKDERTEIKKELKKLNKEKEELLKKELYKKAKKIKEEEKILEDKLNTLEIKKTAKQKKNIVSLKDIAKIINEKTKIPLYEILKDNKKSIQRYEHQINELLIGQQKAKDKTVKLTKLIKLGLKEENRCQSYLFVGPSGVGKTMLAKLFGENLVGLENVIKIDMSEMQEQHSVSKLIGSPPGYIGYKDNKNYFEEIKNKPSSVIILDEIEKANKDVLNIFYQILEDSVIKDAKGDKIHFDNTIIIMTSNIGCLNNNLGFAPNDKKVDNELKEVLGIPFINRIDDYIIFETLNLEEMKLITQNELTKLIKKYPNFKINYNKKIIEEIIEESEYKIYGARKIKKIINEKVKNIIIDSILSDLDKINITTIKDYTLV